MSLTFIDIFCGAGGSSLGLTAAGFELRLAANHWQRAITTHSANFDAEHLCADVNNYDLRRFPPARVLWASPICWEGSPAGGNAKPKPPPPRQMGLADGDEPPAAPGWERTRATAYDVLRAVEVWRYDAVLCENVIEFATRWPLFWWWLDGMAALGYRHRIVCVNTAHIGGVTNPFAPQWRDRMYVVFLRADVPMPDLEPRPMAHCFACGEDVRARQTWKHTPLARQRIGKYRQQYLYTCPNTTRRHDSWTVEPYVLPAASAIDWTDLGSRIGDRTDPLAPATLRKITAGLDLVATGPTVVQVNHTGHDGRCYPATGGALATRTAKGGDGIATSPFIAELRGGGSTVRPIDHPVATITSQGLHHALITPQNGAAPRDGHALVIPYRKGKPTSTHQPLHTLATRDSAALVHPALAVADCHFRMLKAREHLRAQRFPDSYIVTGTATEQTMQAGNAVSANVAQWLGAHIAAALDTPQARHNQQESQPA